MGQLISGVLIASHGRAERLTACLDALALQILPPDEIIVVWQDDDIPTQNAAELFRSRLGTRLKVVHCPERGIVAASNAGLLASRADIVLMIDDDACAAPDWTARHLAFYADDSIAAVGGPFRNFNSDGTPFPVRANEPVGRLRWFGRLIGNTFDHPAEWRARAPQRVEHLSGGNLSFRRNRVNTFEAGLRPYWQYWELDLCLQAARGGRKILFDFSNVVLHYPSNRCHDGRRDGDLDLKCGNPAFNLALVLARHSPFSLSIARLAYLLCVGSPTSPGLFRLPFSMVKQRAIYQELKVTAISMSSVFKGWIAGKRRAT